MSLVKICLYSDSLNVNGYVVGEIKEMAAITIVTMSISIMCLAYTLAMRGAGRGRTTTCDVVQISEKVGAQCPGTGRQL